jgi:adenine-specific DNA-methyltransferase
MPTLDFKGKSFVYAHHLSVPFRELVIDAKKSLPAKGQKPSLDDNLIIHGDNLHALKALLPVYAGKVDCIYIDPPYNTGNEGWCYNDNVRSPLMREWLKKSANPVEKEDLERHDKWLSMMWPRLKLLQELLSDDGAIFISIDDNELHRLRALTDEIFGEHFFLGIFCWKTRNTDNRVKSKLSIDHEYVLVYSRGQGLRGRVIDRSDFQNPDKDPRGPYVTDPLTGKATADRRPNLHYNITNSGNGDLYKPDPARGWITDEPGFKALLKDKRIWWPTSPKTGNPRKKRFLSETEERMPISSFWSDLKGQSGADEVDQILGERLFDFPKSIEFMSRVLDLATNPNSIVLDSFAGSGTTAHAVLALNKKDGGNRKFILVETEAYADKVTAERVRRVIRGYKFEGMQREELLREPLTWAKLKNGTEIVKKADSFDFLDAHRFDRILRSVENGELVVAGEKKVTDKAEGLGGSFAFVTLGPEMSLDKLLADGLPTLEALAKYVFFTATGRTLSDLPRQTAATLGFIGETDLYRVHLLYKAGKEWLQSNDSALTEKLVDEMVATNPEKKKLLVFAAAKFMSQRELSRRGVEFCQLPYAIHRILGD